MQRFAPSGGSRDADRRARGRFIAATLASLFVHALITTGVPSGQRGHGAGEALLTPRAALDVELHIAPDPPRVSAEAEGEQHAAAAPEPRSEPKKAPAARDRAVSVEAAPRDAHVGPADIPDPTYYGARELDVYPVLASALKLDDGPRPPRSPRSGRVLLLVLIDADGSVNEVSVIEAEPAGVFDERTRAAFQAARFVPALRNGRPVKSRLLVDVDYSDSSSR